jgi:hypothetical protein
MWQVLQAHTAPQLWCKFTSLSKATSSIISPLEISTVTGDLSFSSKLKVIVGIIKVANLDEF